jgi:hypothetical protein
MNTAKTTAQIALTVSMVVAVGLELHAAAMSLLVVPMTLWVASPFGLMLWATRSRWATPASCWTLLAGALLLALSAVQAYRPSVIASGSTAAPSFVFAPLYQNLGALVFVGAASLLGRRDHRSRR